MCDIQHLLLEAVSESGSGEVNRANSTRVLRLRRNLEALKRQRLAERVDIATPLNPVSIAEYAKINLLLVEEAERTDATDKAFYEFIEHLEKNYQRAQDTLILFDAVVSNLEIMLNNLHWESKDLEVFPLLKQVKKVRVLGCSFNELMALEQQVLAIYRKPNFVPLLKELKDEN